VPHDADWTYSVAFPPGHEWHGLKAEESYRRIHDWLRLAFAKLKVETGLAPCCKKSLPGQCFVGHEKYDLLWGEKKIAGAAQRRNQLGLLIQGSIQPPLIPLKRVEFEHAMCSVARENFHATIETLVPDAILRHRTEELRSNKFSQSSYNRKR
jgi:lipoate-protein ligase A